MSSDSGTDAIEFWENAPSHIRKFALSETARRYEAQIELMLAADQRALGMAGLGAAILAVGLGALFALDDPIEGILKLLAFGVGVFSALGTVCCWWAARPIDVYPKGWTLSDFRNNVESGSSESRLEAEICYWADDRIRRNDKSMKFNSWCFKIGSGLILFSPIIGFACAFFV